MHGFQNGPRQRFTLKRSTDPDFQSLQSIAVFDNKNLSKLSTDCHSRESDFKIPWFYCLFTVLTFTLHRFPSRETANETKNPFEATGFWKLFWPSLSTAHALTEPRREVGET